MVTGGAVAHTLQEPGQELREQASPGGWSGQCG